MSVVLRIRSGIKPGSYSGAETPPLSLLTSPSYDPPFFLLLLDCQSSTLIMKFTAVIPFILGAGLQAFAQVADANAAAELVADLKKAPTQVARLNILQNNRDVSASL